MVRISDELKNSIYISDYKLLAHIAFGQQVGFFLFLFFFNKLSTQHYEIRNFPFSISTHVSPGKDRKGGREDSTGPVLPQ